MEPPADRVVLLHDGDYTRLLTSAAEQEHSSRFLGANGPGNKAEDVSHGSAPGTHDALHPLSIAQTYALKWASVAHSCVNQAIRSAIRRNMLACTSHEHLMGMLIREQRDTFAPHALQATTALENALHACGTAEDVCTAHANELSGVCTRLQFDRDMRVSIPAVYGDIQAGFRRMRHVLSEHEARYEHMCDMAAQCTARIVSVASGGVSREMEAYVQSTLDANKRADAEREALDTQLELAVDTSYAACTRIADASAHHLDRLAEVGTRSLDFLGAATRACSEPDGKIRSLSAVGTSLELAVTQVSLCQDRIRGVVERWPHNVKPAREKCCRAIEALHGVLLTIQETASSAARVTDMLISGAHDSSQPAHAAEASVGHAKSRRMACEENVRLSAAEVDTAQTTLDLAQHTLKHAQGRDDTQHASVKQALENVHSRAHIESLKEGLEQAQHRHREAEQRLAEARVYEREAEIPLFLREAETAAGHVKQCMPAIIECVKALYNQANALKYARGQFDARLGPVVHRKRDYDMAAAYSRMSKDVLEWASVGCSRLRTDWTKAVSEPVSGIEADAEAIKECSDTLRRVLLMAPAATNDGESAALDRAAAAVGVFCKEAAALCKARQAWSHCMLLRIAHEAGQQLFRSENAA